MNPGATTIPCASIRRVAVAAANFPIAAIRPPRIPTSPEYHGEPVPSMIRPLAMMTSKLAAGGAAAGVEPIASSVQHSRIERIDRTEGELELNPETSHHNASPPAERRTKVSPLTPPPHLTPHPSPHPSSLTPPPSPHPSPGPPQPPPPLRRSTFSRLKPRDSHLDAGLAIPASTRPRRIEKAGNSSLIPRPSPSPASISVELAPHQTPRPSSPASPRCRETD